MESFVTIFIENLGLVLTTSKDETNEPAEFFIFQSLTLKSSIVLVKKKQLRFDSMLSRKNDITDIDIESNAFLNSRLDRQIGYRILSSTPQN